MKSIVLKRSQVSSRLPLLIAVGGFPFLLLVAAWVYFGGLAGTFTLDDSVNLAGLSQIGNLGNLDEISQFVFSGMAGGLGRPITLATFAAQFYSWPYDVTSFRYVNVLIHLFNGCLLFWLALELGKQRYPAYRATLYAIIATSLWLLHPLHVSTVLYVVQRMSELAAFFILAGLLAYVKSRSILLQQGRVTAGYIAMSCSILLGTTLAALSKENGILLPLFALTLEATVLRPLHPPRLFRTWKILFLVTPLLALAGWFAWNFDRVILNTYKIRPFTFSERMWTESRVLWDYMEKFFYPVAQPFGVFHDDFLISHGWLTPPSTLFAVGALVLIIFLAIRLRHRAPFLSLGVFWFLGGHILESTFIPLEIYFEHRNYLPTIGLALAATQVGIYLYELASRKLKPYVVGGTIALSLLLAALTYQEAILWSTPLKQAFLWEKQHPNSMRAKEWLGASLAKAGYPQRAASVYAQMANANPYDATGYTYMFYLSCHFPESSLPDRRTAESRLKQATYSTGALSGLDAILALKEEGVCNNVDDRDLMALIDALLDNPKFSPRHSNVFAMKSRLLALQGDFAAALEVLGESYARSPRIETALLQATWAAKLGRRGDVHRHIRNAETLNGYNSLLRRPTYSNKINELRSSILGNTIGENTAR